MAHFVRPSAPPPRRTLPTADAASSCWRRWQGPSRHRPFPRARRGSRCAGSCRSRPPRSWSRCWCSCVIPGVFLRRMQTPSPRRHHQHRVRSFPPAVDTKEDASEARVDRDQRQDKREKNAAGNTPAALEDKVSSKTAVDALARQRAEPQGAAATPAKPAQAPQPPPPPAAPQSFKAEAARENVAQLQERLAKTVGLIASPDPAVQWRFSGRSIERTLDGGQTWNTQEQRPRTCSPALHRRPASVGSSAGPASSCSRATARRGRHSPLLHRASTSWPSPPPTSCRPL